MFYQRHIFVCINQKPAGQICCANSGGQQTADYLKAQLQTKGLFGPGKVRVSTAGCLGRCKLGPSMVIYPEGLWFNCHTPDDVDRFIDQYLIQGQPVPELMVDSNQASNSTNR